MNYQDFDLDRQQRQRIEQLESAMHGLDQRREELDQREEELLREIESVIEGRPEEIPSA